MQAVEYNMLDSEALEGGSANSPEEDGEGAGESLRLEEMLLTKNQQLERRLAEANRLMDGKLEEVSSKHETGSPAPRRTARCEANCKTLQRKAAMCFHAMFNGGCGF